MRKRISKYAFSPSQELSFEEFSEKYWPKGKWYKPFYDKSETQDWETYLKNKRPHLVKWYGLLVATGYALLGWGTFIAAVLIIPSLAIITFFVLTYFIDTFSKFCSSLF